MNINTYKTEEMIAGKLDRVLHTNLLDALGWARVGIDVQIYRQEGGEWVKVNGAHTAWELEALR